MHLEKLLASLSLPIDIDLLLESVALVNGIKRSDIAVPENFQEALDCLNYMNDRSKDETKPEDRPV